VAQATVFTDEAAFDAGGPTAQVTFPPDESTALPNHPYSALTDYSCGPSGPSPDGVDLSVPGLALPATLHVEVPGAAAGSSDCRIFFIGSGWNGGLGNINPTPVSPTIVGNGEDDLQLDFSVPVVAVGLRLLTNSLASETVTLTYADTSTQTIADSSLGTSVNRFEFIGFKSTTPIVSMFIDNTGGGTQNEGLVGVKVRAYEVSIDIKPGSFPNSVNINGNGVIPVAILGSQYFDVTWIDPSTLLFNGSSVRVRGKKGPQCSVQDVSGDFTYPEGAPDGYPDLVCQFVDDPEAWTEGAAVGSVDGLLTDGTPFSGTDSINIVKYTP
jgi:hypothetical protein